MLCQENTHRIQVSQTCLFLSRSHTLHAGFSGIPVRNLFKGSQFIGRLNSEDALSSDSWYKSRLSEKWQGSVIVFTLPADVFKDPLQAGLARMKFARLVQLLR